MEKLRSLMGSGILSSRRLFSARNSLGGRAASGVAADMRVRDYGISGSSTLGWSTGAVRGVTVVHQRHEFSSVAGDQGKGPEDFDSLDDYLLSIDTTIPEEKLAHVEALKKSIKGGHRSERSLYRDVPTQEELEAIKFQGNFLPKIAPNAEALIDWALSHVPERAGRRGTRKAKRMLRRGEIKRADDARRKTERVAAIARKQAKLNAHREKANKYRLEAARLRGEIAQEAEESLDARQGA